MTRCLMPLVVMEMQIKLQKLSTTHLSEQLIGMAHVGKNVQNWNLTHCWSKCKMVQSLWENV